MRSLWIASLVLPAIGAAQTPTRWTLYLDAGAAFQNRNDASVPGNGTRFSFKDLQGSGGFPFGRVTAFYNLTPRSGFRLVLAPLTIRGTGTFGSPVNFDGQTFAPNVATRGSYTFNSWRASYWTSPRIADPRTTVRLGITAKVRDARIALEQNGVERSFTDLGFVPLFHASYERTLGTRWRAVVDFDGAAASQGRAFDLGVLAAYKLNDRVDLTAGYRFLDGGADNDKVYTFAFFQYASIGLSLRF